MSTSPVRVQICFGWATKAFFYSFETSRHSQNAGALDVLVIHMKFLRQFPKQKAIVKWPM